MQPQIISFEKIEGSHNADLEAAGKRLDRSATYKDLSTVIIIPALDNVAVKVVAAWWSIVPLRRIKRCARLFAQGWRLERHTSGP